MSYEVLYETVSRAGDVTTYAEPATANANRAMTAMTARRAAGLTTWIKCGNGQILTSASWQ